MLRLTTFGGVALTQDGRPVTGAAGGRRRLALLALLTTSGARGIDRDRLAELLWPDSEIERGRHSLHQMLSDMRRTHGAEQLFVGAPAVHLNPECITSDAWEFEAALRSRQPERAVAVYAGPFASDLTIPGATDLHHRLDEIRAAFAGEYAAALDTLARDATARGDVTSAVRWRRRLADSDPLSARNAKGLIEAYVAAGERIQALQFALVHESLIRQEFDSAPDPEIAQWILRLRAPDSVSTIDAAPAPNVSRPISLTIDSGLDLDAWKQRMLARLTRSIGAKYQVTGLIAEAAVAMTFSGASRTHGTPEVEIHVIDPHIATVVNAARFAEVLGRTVALGHRHVHPVIDFGAGKDLLFYVTTKRVGETLRERLRHGGELPIPEAVQVARDIASALAHAHARGVRHGDLRPKYIALTSNGAVVSGLGVIEAIAHAHETSSGSSTVVALGSPSYLAPEQIMNNNDPVNPRHDVYAFGAIVYEMLAGEPPFGRSGKSPGIRAKLHDPAPNLTGLRDTVPESLARIVHTCLARVPADRYATGEDLARALAELDSLAQL